MFRDNGFVLQSVTYSLRHSGRLLDSSSRQTILNLASVSRAVAMGVSFLLLWLLLKFASDVTSKVQ